MINVLIILGRQYPASQSDYTVVAVNSPTASLYILTDLQKFTWYEIRIQPFYLTVKGAESNLFRIRTLPDRTFLLIIFLLFLIQFLISNA